MKQRYDSVSVGLFLVLIIIISSTSNITSATARKLGAKQAGEADAKSTHNLSTINHYYSLPNNMQTSTLHDSNFYKVMGLEDQYYCQNGDEECLKRRATAEAHLDYIYTQHHQP